LKNQTCINETLQRILERVFGEIGDRRC